MGQAEPRLLCFKVCVNVNELNARLGLNCRVWGTEGVGKKLNNDSEKYLLNIKIRKERL